MTERSESLASGSAKKAGAVFSLPKMFEKPILKGKDYRARYLVGKQLDWDSLGSLEKRYDEAVEHISELWGTMVWMIPF
jgi:hypothetical protein